MGGAAESCVVQLCGELCEGELFGENCVGASAMALHSHQGVWVYTKVVDAWRCSTLSFVGGNAVEQFQMILHECMYICMPGVCGLHDVRT